MGNTKEERKDMTEWEGGGGRQGDWVMVREGACSAKAGLEDNWLDVRMRRKEGGA